MAVYPERDPKGVELSLTDEVREKQRLPPKQNTLAGYLFRVPWWGLIIIGIGIFVYISIAANEEYSRAFDQLQEGIVITTQVTVFSYLGGLTVGLLLAVARSSYPKPKKGLIPGLFSILHLLAYNVATFFVEVMRGLPILVLLVIAAYIVTPAFKEFMLERFEIEITFRATSVETCIIALSMAYGAFLSEIFRAGIQSIEKGQIEAAKSIGMNNFQVMRFIVLPQAVRRVLPPLGNDFIAMIKDSSLVAYIGVRDLTQVSNVYAGSNFRFVETYLTVAVIYLTLTLIGSLLVRLLENHLKTESR